MSTEEALWSIEIQPITDLGGDWQNGGIAVLERGRLLGGDTAIYFLGRYEIEDSRITGKARTVSYAQDQALSVFGDMMSNSEVLFEGRVEAETIEGMLYRAEDPDEKLAFRLTRQENLPSPR